MIQCPIILHLSLHQACIAYVCTVAKYLPEISTNHKNAAALPHSVPRFGLLPYSFESLEFKNAADFFRQSLLAYSCCSSPAELE